MSKQKVFVTRIIAQQALDKITEETEMELWQEELPPPYEVLLQKARDAEGMLTLLTDTIDAPLMDAAPKLKVVSNLAVGYDNIDVAEAITNLKQLEIAYQAALGVSARIIQPTLLDFLR